MSITALLNPSLSSLLSSDAANPASKETLSFNHQPTYISLSRMLTRYQHILLFQPPSDSLSPLQQQIQSELRSPLPFHRNKWLHNIEHARTLLLQLEHAAQSIKFQRQKREAIHDLAEKRVLIKKLRRQIEDIGREVESMGERAWKAGGDEQLGETVEELLGRPPPETTAANSSAQHDRSSSTLQAGKPVTSVLTDESEPDNAATILSGKPYTTTSSSTARRRRAGDPTSTSTDPSSSSTRGETTSADTPRSTERTLLAASRVQEDLTSSLVSMASQLKQQARNLSASLDADKGLLNRALEGIDRNVSGMAAASKNMAFLRRMSEGQGWFGRLKLYAMIFGLWILAILLVFVGPKFRF